MENLKDGNYKGIGDGDQGEIEVFVKIKNGHIDTAVVIKEQETPEIGWKALPGLEKEVLKNQTYNIDTISGATNTTNGYRQAVKDALDKAKKN